MSAPSGPVRATRPGQKLPVRYLTSGYATRKLWDLAGLKLKPKRTWDEAALRWLKEKAPKKSYRDDVSRIRWFTRHLRGKTLDQVSRDMIDGIASRHLARRSDRTKDLYVALIRAIFGKAMREWEWLDQIRAFKTDTKGSKIRVRYLTQDQAKALLQRLSAHQREVVSFALATGLCQGNILALTWDRVDFDRRIVTIRDGDTKRGGARRVPERGGPRRFGTAKGQACGPYVHLSGQAAPDGEHAHLARRLEGLRDRGFPLARPAAHLSELVPAERRAHLGASRAGGREVGGDGAPLCAHVDEALATLCRPADLSGHRGGFV